MLLVLGRIRGIRNNKDNVAKYLPLCMEKIKRELRQQIINVKCSAVAKLTYVWFCCSKHIIIGDIGWNPVT
uniref:Uncharacterized protein n=1 Tax=Glossina palpalis gambiensis TaxID=67801 RepID=A0A1B0BT34_9MUSC